MNQLIRASMVRLITPRSVLLSTKTRNAPIPLINHSKKYIHPMLNAVLKKDPSSCCVMFLKKLITLYNAHSPNNNESHQLILFITTATVSGASVKDVNG